VNTFEGRRDSLDSITCLKMIVVHKLSRNLQKHLLPVTKPFIQTSGLLAKVL